MIAGLISTLIKALKPDELVASGQAEVLFHTPEQGFFYKKLVPANQPIVDGVEIDKAGKLNISSEEMSGVSSAMRIIRKVAPDAQVAVCRSIFINGINAGAALIYGDEHTLPTIMIGLNDAELDEYKEYAYHECFHHAETFLSQKEFSVLKRWTALIDRSITEAPPFVIRKGMEEWWSQDQERRAWAFEHYLHLTILPRSEEYAENYGFKLKLEHFPASVRAIYDAIISGEVGKRAFEYNTAQGSLM